MNSVASIYEDRCKIGVDEFSEATSRSYIMLVDFSDFKAWIRLKGSCKELKPYSLKISEAQTKATSWIAAKEGEVR